jgi:DNA repair exonuclease SbcCD ATPase subunit
MKIEHNHEQRDLHDRLVQEKAANARRMSDLESRLSELKAQVKASSETNAERLKVIQQRADNAITDLDRASGRSAPTRRRSLTRPRKST